MGIQRALTLFPRNDTTVDTGAGIDIRLLADANTGTNDVTQTCTAVNTNDNVERTFDPATAGVTTVSDARTLQKLGWGLRLADDMTPGDDTNCDVVIPAQTVAVSMDVGLAWTGTPLQTSNPTWRCGLFRYNPSTDTGTAIADGSGTAAAAWNNLTENGVFKTVTFNITVPVTTFSAGEILVAQFGFNTGTLGNPAIGTSTFTMTFRINNAVSKTTQASTLIQTCALAESLVGDGVNTRGILDAGISRDLVGAGVLTESRGIVASKSFSLVGDGVVTRQMAITESKNVTGDGVLSESRAVVAGKTFDLVGDGTVTRESLPVGISRSLVGDGVLDSSKATVAAKTFDLTGDGTITDLHPVQAFRTFNLVGDGEILLSGPNGSTITLPLDELPTGACPSDWTPNDGLKSISGDVFFHEPPNEGDPVVGAVVTLIRDSDGLLITTAVTDAAGHYTFPRDSNDPNTYHVEVRYSDVGGDQQGLSEGGCAPV